jgi:NADH-quinone oxidoreductase subunit A
MYARTAAPEWHLTLPSSPPYSACTFFHKLGGVPSNGCASAPKRVAAGSGPTGVDRVLRDYLPILIMLVLSAGFALFALFLSWVLSPRRSDPIKDGPYECGVDPIGDARMRHSIRFYVVAMLFIIFDLETVFLYPWAVTYKQLGLFGLVEMIIFLAILMVGYVYVWRRGALNWSEQAEADQALRMRREFPDRATGTYGGDWIDPYDRR